MIGSLGAAQQNPGSDIRSYFRKPGFRCAAPRLQLTAIIELLFEVRKFILQ